MLKKTLKTYSRTMVFCAFYCHVFVVVKT